MPIRQRFWQTCKKRFAFLIGISHLCKRNDEDNGKYLVVAHLQLKTVSSHCRSITKLLTGTLTYSVLFFMQQNNKTQ
jgi:hypothetical protein